MKKLNAKEIFESVKHEVSVTKLEEDLFLAIRTLKRGDITLTMEEKINAQGVDIANAMNIRGAISPFVIVPLHPEWCKYLNKEEEEQLAVFNSMFTDEELAALVEFYTSHEDYREAVDTVENEILPKVMEEKVL